MSQQKNASAPKPTKPLTVRDAAFDILHTYGLTRMFANPGSTEITLLADLPADLEFILALQEGSVVGMATGHALATDHAALVVVHTTAGLGNAVGAIATARVNKAPLVIIVGQQDRRHLATQPFLAGRLHGLLGDYPVWFNEPVTAQDVPAAIARAFHEATTHRGPAVVVVPMDDWATPYDLTHVLAAPDLVRSERLASPLALAELATHIDAAFNPVMVVGAGNATDAGWSAAVDLAEKLQLPVYQESFGARPGFPQDHHLFAGFLSSARSTLRGQLAGHDLILAVGAPVFRQYNFEPGAMYDEGATVLLLTDDTDEAHRSRASMVVIADPAPALATLVDHVKLVSIPRSVIPPRRTAPVPPDASEPIRASHVMALLGKLLPADAIVAEETPSSRPDMHELMPARSPLGFVSAAMGGLGFGLPAAIGLRMGNPTRPVVAVLGDGSALYNVQGLWSAGHYNVGTLFVILNNERYAVMDRLAERASSAPPAWPAFDTINFVNLATSLGCESQRLSDYGTLAKALTVAVAGLATRTTPLVLIVDVEPELHFAP
ncbi:MAG: thiamine pyrophosphate-binding protein [Actinomycetales bacterium]|nr:thiamine pyrophosphate-binding protein [Actinomycetales bacterium]